MINGSMVISSVAQSLNVCVYFSELNSLIINNLFCFLLHIGKHDKFRHLALMNYELCSELGTLQCSQFFFDDFIGSPSTKASIEFDEFRRHRRARE
jgi:hypothetical protein